MVFDPKLSNFLSFWEEYLGKSWMQPKICLLVTIITTFTAFLIFSLKSNVNEYTSLFILYLMCIGIPYFIYSFLMIIDLTLLCFYYGKDEDDRLDLIMCLVVPFSFTVSVTNICVIHRYLQPNSWVLFYSNLIDDPFIIVWIEMFFLLSSLTLSNNALFVLNRIFFSFYNYMITVIIIPVVIAGCVGIILEHKGTHTITFSSNPNKTNDTNNKILLKSLIIAKNVN